MSTIRTHVVLGTGALGSAVIRALQPGDASIRAVNRSGEAPVPDGVEVVNTDLSDADDARRVCQEASVVYFCVQPPYTEWPRLFPPLLEEALTGAEEAGARFVVAENCYMYGPTEEPLTENHPYDATGSKGTTRAEMTRTAMAAHEQGRLEVAIGRASDFYGPGVRSSMVGDRVFRNALSGKTTLVLGDPDTRHTYTYIDDFANGLVTLGEHPEAVGEVWHVPSAETMTTREFIEMIYEHAGVKPRIRRVPN